MCQRKMRSICAKGVSLDVVRGAEGTRWVGIGWYGTRRRERRRRGGGGQTLLAAESLNARRLLQVKMHQSCLKSG